MQSIDVLLFPQADVLDWLGQSREDREGRHGRVREGGDRPPRGGQLAQRSLARPGDGPALLGGRQAPPHLQQQPWWREYQVIVLED